MAKKRKRRRRRRRERCSKLKIVKVGTFDLPFEPTFNFSTDIFSPTPADPVKGTSNLPFAFVPVSFPTDLPCIHIFVDSKNNKILQSKSALPLKNRSKISLVHFSDSNLPDRRFFLYYENENFRPQAEILFSPESFAKELSYLLLAGVRKKEIKFNTNFFERFKSSNRGVYKIGRKQGCTKWAVHNFIISFFFTYFPSFNITGDMLFRDDWDGIVHRFFTHWKFPCCTLLNPPYLEYATEETFLTLEQFVEHCLCNFRAFGDGFVAILPAYSKFKLKKNKSTFWANRKNLPNWFLRLYNHDRVAMVLLDKRIKFLKSTFSEGKFRRKAKGLAPFDTVLVFFGFRKKHLLASNTAASFISPVDWLKKLYPLQGAFQPKTFLSQSLFNRHTDWIQHAHKVSEKIAPNDLSVMPAKAQQGFVIEEKLSTWDWTPHLIKYNSVGKRLPNRWDGKFLLSPKLHPDLDILYSEKKKWKSPLVEISYDDKKELLADIKLQNQEKGNLNQKKFCDYCCRFGHKRKFCDWLPHQRDDWCEEHKKLYQFFSVQKMMAIPSFGPNPTLRQLQEFMQSVYRAEKLFWENFKTWSGLSRKDIPFPTLCWGNLPQRIGALHQIGVSPRFLADMLTGADLQYKEDEVGEPVDPLRVLLKNKFSKAEKVELKKELLKGNKMRYLVPIPSEFVFSAENAFFKESSGKLRFIQDLQLLCSKVRTPAFKLKDAIEIFSILHPLAFACTADVKNAYRAILQHPSAAAKQVFHCEDDDGNDQFFLPRGFVFGNASNCAYCEAFFKNVICRVLCSLSPSLYASNYLDDFVFLVAIFEGAINFELLLGEAVVKKIVRALELNYSDLNFEFFYSASAFPFFFDKVSKKYKSKRTAAGFERNFQGEIGTKLLLKLQTLEQNLANAYTAGVRNFVFEFMGYFLPLNSKSQVQPTRTYQYLGFLADYEELAMTPRPGRISKLCNLLTPCFDKDVISIKIVQQCLGILNSLQINSTVMANLKYLLSKYLSAAHRHMGFGEDVLPDSVISDLRPCPANLADAFLKFLHYTEDFAFTPLAMSSKQISLHTTHPNAHYWPKAEARNVITQFVDTSNYSVGSYLHKDGQLSYLETSHLPEQLLGSHTLRSAFKASSTTRELYDILISLERNLDYLKSLQVDGLRICCDNKAALWMIFSRKAKKPLNQKLVNDIHQLLSGELHYPVELHWLRRSKYSMQAADLASKKVCHFNGRVTEFFNQNIREVFQLQQFFHLGHIPDAIKDLRSPHQPLGDCLPKTNKIFVLAAPLNVAKAETLVDLCFLQKKSCILVLPKIFGAKYMDSLRKTHPFFFATFRQLYAGVPYLGFDAFVVYLKF